MTKPQTPPLPPLRLPFMVLVTAFTGSRTDHPGRKTGCPFRRGCYKGKISRDKRWKKW